ncbi:MAG: outer membrane protein beta-barrel domain [Acidobacteriota bacterium]|nr:outer membrane protein beta-barrel domain [Acidobacteriota bacterium]
MVRSILVRGILLVAGVAFGCISAPASAQFYFGVSAGMYQPEDEGKSGTEIFDVRGGYRVRPRAGFEWSFSRVTLDEAVDPAILPFDFDEFNVSADVTNLDLSVQWFPRGGNFVVFGGPGIAMLDSRINVVFIGVPFTDTDITNIFTAHAGAGYAWQLGNGFFLLPEVRARRYFGAEVKAPSAVEGFRFSYQATDIEAGLTVGWRFGS